MFRRIMPPVDFEGRRFLMTRSIKFRVLFYTNTIEKFQRAYFDIIQKYIGGYVHSLIELSPS
jgi:hypothetical protein